MSENKSKPTKESAAKKNVATWLTFVFLLLALITVWLGVQLIHPLFAIFGVGAISFAGTLYIANYLSQSNNIDQGEIRKALATSLTMVYFALLSVTLFQSKSAVLIDKVDKEIIKTVIEKYTDLMIGVIGFYFGTRGATEFVKAYKGGGEEEEEETSEESSIEGDTDVLVGTETEYKVAGGNEKTTWSIDEANQAKATLSATTGEKVTLKAVEITEDSPLKLTATTEDGKSATIEINIVAAAG